MTRSQKIVVSLFIGLPCLFCVGGGVFVQLQISSVGNGLQGELATAKSLGMPLFPSELKRQIPTHQNAAVEYLKAMARAPEKSPGVAALDKVAKAVAAKATDADRRAGAKAFAECQGLVRLVERAADKPHCDFEKDWNQGFSLMFPEYVQLKRYVHLLNYKARQQSHSGDWRGALATVHRMQNISRHAGEEPILIAMLVQLANESITQKALRELIREHARDPIFLDAADRVADEFGPLPRFKYSLRGELVCSRTVIYHLRNMSELSGGGASDGTDVLGKLLESSGALRVAFDCKLVEAYNKLIASLPDDPNDWKGTKEASIRHNEWLQKDTSAFNLMNQMLFPVFSQAAMSIGRAEANRNLTKASLLLLRQRLATGTFPAQLPSDKIFTDPLLDDKPLKYKRYPDGFLLYSVDQDGVDNGGVISTGSSERDLVADMRKK